MARLWTICGIDAALERISAAETSETSHGRDRREQYEAYEKTLRALEDVTPTDDEA